jgi:hypothetical protein
MRADIFRNTGRRAEALAEAATAFDRAPAIKPEPYILVNRAMARPKADRAGRRVDFNAALKLDPIETRD